MRAFGRRVIGFLLALISTQALAIDEYRLDDGVKELGIGVQSTGTNSIAWLNRFVVQPGNATITAVRVAFGGSLAQSNIANGSLVSVYLWYDPNQDGNPVDALLLESGVGLVQGSGTNAFATYPLNAPVSLTVGDIFYAGAIVNYSGQLLVGSLDVDGTDDVNPYPPSFHSFVASSNNGTPVSPTALGTAQGPVASVSSAIFGGSGDANWMVRLNAPPPSTPQLAINPNPLDFGQVVVGTVFGPLLTMLTNVGTANLDITAISSAPLPFFSPPPGSGLCPAPPFTLPPSAQCAIHFSFGPTATGLSAANVSITSNAPTSPDTLQLTGFGITGPAPQPSITPLAIDMGEVDVEGVSLPATVTLENSGTADWAVNSIQPTVAGPSPFTFVFSTCPPLPFLVLPGASCTLDILFQPTVHGINVRTFEFVGNTPPGTVLLQLRGKGMLFGDGFDGP